MYVDKLTPQFDLMCEQYVLVQAWKKTVSYIRSHNWYADTLEIDQSSVNLPNFLGDLSDELRNFKEWSNDSIRIVPAPKSQEWHINPTTGRWEPVDKKETVKRLRPLAYVSLRDQVACTALMLCLADRVETLQNDPRHPINTIDNRKRIISYGNRLYCDVKRRKLTHRWGSTKLYRSYFQDYRQFLSRPENVASSIEESDSKVVIVQSDIKQFYDRVHPKLLSDKLHSLRNKSDDLDIYTAATILLNWSWDKKDTKDVNRHAEETNLSDFSEIALPQGLVSAGFFANVVLLDFDQALRDSFGMCINNDIILHDACRYVDDIRLVLSVRSSKLANVEECVIDWLNDLLHQHAKGLVVSKQKTLAAYHRAEDRPLILQSQKMERIQQSISGGFDAIAGQEIIDAIQGLVRSQARYSKERMLQEGWLLAPIPDVRDDTVARFAAARFRTTFRSLRPLLEDCSDSEDICIDSTIDETLLGIRKTRTRKELDDEAKAYALGLIENWIIDPSNVRLLRIGLDIWPSAEILNNILKLIHQYTEKGGGRNAPRRVAWYCLSEIFRAGATETGIVEDGELLPDKANFEEYRKTLLKEAKRLANMPVQTLPWYLRQQVMLFLAVTAPVEAPVVRKGKNVETKAYRDLIFFLRGERKNIKDKDFATMSVLTRRSYLGKTRTQQLIVDSLTSNRLKLIVERDVAFGLEILESNQDLVNDISMRQRHDLCLMEGLQQSEWPSIGSHILGGKEELRNECVILEFSRLFLNEVKRGDIDYVITPCDIAIQFSNRDRKDANIAELMIKESRISTRSSIYEIPSWCSCEEAWRFRLGYILRFILTKQQDFSKSVRRDGRPDDQVIYRIPEAHIFQRLHGLYSGHSAFGEDWLPITEWMENFLLALLRWPGCRKSAFWEQIIAGIDTTMKFIDKRIEQLRQLQKDSDGMLIMPVTAPWYGEHKGERPLRICVAQTVVPNTTDIDINDLSFSDMKIRRRHRRHLSTMLQAVEKMLDLRETHRNRGGRLDMLILPELAVHPLDIDTHILPFVQAHKTIVVAGLTYEELIPGMPLVNTALWLIPTWSSEYGFNVIRRRQGKFNLAPEEAVHNTRIERIRGFRPCQWIVDYVWNSRRMEENVLRMTAAVCYDATDIRLAAALRNISDIFIVPALNKDVTTFDNMAHALHYHMFQLIIIANNGEFGGSNAYAPYRLPHERQIFHMHGQPQATIVFMEIEDIEEFLNRGTQICRNEKKGNDRRNAEWKCPPAGYENDT